MPFGFTVDTHLFRELGELLVGRDSTALVELIKNAYDADATLVRVRGDRLSGQAGMIIIEDDGVGMDADTFEKGFLRVASRLKEHGARRSNIYGRRYTGAKGVGRLAAHKLAALVRVRSIPDPRVYPSLPASVDALIDWDLVEQQETLDAVEGSGAVRVQTRPYAGEPAGTRLLLERLRRPWTSAELTRFVHEVQSFHPPDFFVEPVQQSVLPKPLVLGDLTVRDADGPTIDPGIRVELEGDFETGDPFWKYIHDRTDWIIEIDARSVPGTVIYGVAPTVRKQLDNPLARARTFRDRHPEPNSGPYFQARIFALGGSWSQGLPKSLGSVARQQAGVRVYMEGFRVLPYGESGNDWLGIDRDYVRRDVRLETFADDRFKSDFKDGPPVADIGLFQYPARNYFGAVFLTLEQARGLEMLVNREGFLPNRHFDALQRIIRTGIDLSVRVRAAARGAKKSAGRSSSTSVPASSAAGQGPDLKAAVNRDAREWATAVHDAVKEARSAIAAGDAKMASAALARAEEAAPPLVEHLAQAADEQALLRTVAAVGTQMSTFVHDLNGLVETSRVLSDVLAEMCDDPLVPPNVRPKLRSVYRSFLSVRQSLERFASYLYDVVSPDARRRRSRQSLRDRLEAAWRLVAERAARRDIVLENQIPEDVRTPPMFAAEITSVFLNLMTNAVKAAGTGGRIRARGGREADGTTWVTVENTGVAVDLADGDRWFRPFESTTVEVDAVLGQGMGLGLPIARRIVEEYGATIRFVRPDTPFATSVRIEFPAP